MARRRWRDLSGRQRHWIAVGAVIQVCLTGAALIDLRRRPAERINGSRRFWTMAAFVDFIGPLAYFLRGRRRL
ncbi:hypothetical protein HDA32_002590 [Spinactinospora alkalitolerans]|uniref:Cardiolipin synthase N-terminal domain-containing protein n=1 Tax=Spinactinospora alkalitolerans TaxID=687207 RepID=A0A852U0C3_9ACTN|nr:hypothetical protein [Spinactinospora alkalitolerans]NYE47470.1 hypothetical protein [Spinactinospora alkalitolerans]